MMTVLITGGTGFIGRAVCHALKAHKKNVVILTRTPKAVQSGERAVASLDEIADTETLEGIINLAGAPINHRWTKAYKKTLLHSRVGTTANVISLITRLKTKPAFLISASAVGYYGPQPATHKTTEDTPPQESFTHTLCHAWETKAREAEALGVRTCLVRLGVVLDKEGGLFKELHGLYQWCLGGRIGSGTQGLPWIHREDVVRALIFLMEHSKMQGAYNLTAPEVTSQQTFSQTLGRVLGRPTLMPLPACVVRLLFGEMGQELLLHGAYVYPEKLLKAGFTFTHPRLHDALKAIVDKQDEPRLGA
ncbi:TIGR01777 family protein [bacterium NHP-B]|nr:TIGR01777 family protein [bacterium NHP-B]